MFTTMNGRRWAPGLGVCVLLLVVPLARSAPLPVPVEVHYSGEAYAQIMWFTYDPYGFPTGQGVYEPDIDPTTDGEAHASVAGPTAADLGSRYTYDGHAVDLWSELHAHGWREFPWGEYEEAGLAQTSLDGTITIGTSDEYPAGTGLPLLFYTVHQLSEYGSGITEWDYEFTAYRAGTPYVLLDPEHLNEWMTVYAGETLSFSFGSSAFAFASAPGTWEDIDSDVTIRIPEPGTGTLAALLGITLAILRRRAFGAGAGS
jgi:hypothetical protein